MECLSCSKLHYEKFADGTVREVDVPYELPEGWEWVRLTDIASLSGGKTPSTANKSYWEKGMIPWITSKDMKENYLYSSQTLMTGAGLATTSLIKPNSLLMVTRSGILKHTFPVALLKKESAINQDLKAAEFFDTRISEFVFLVFKASNKKILSNFKKDGTTVDSVDFDSLKKMIFGIPPLDELIHIVEASKNLIEKTEIIESEQQSLQQLSTQLKQKVLDVAMQGKLVPQDPNDEPASVLLDKIRAEKQRLFEEGKLKKKDLIEIPISAEDSAHYGKLPLGWELSNFSNLTTHQTLNDGEWVVSNDMTDYSDIKLIQLGSIGYGEYRDKGFKYISDETFTKLNCKEIYEGYLLINRLIADKMFVTILPNIDGKLITAVDVCWLSPNISFNQKFMMFQLMSSHFQNTARELGAGSTRLRISKGNLIRIPIVLPPKVEQKRILEFINLNFGLLNSLIQ